jgi:hypothetical protein
MRKTNVLLIIALALALLASVAWNSTASAQMNQPVGVVVAYVPGQSITIVDQQGNQSEYTLDPSLKILPPGRAESLAVGSFVTVIAPASVSNGKQTAVGIVVHPQIPNGWNISALSATPFATQTAPGPVGSETPTVTGTLPTETPTAPVTETPTTFVIETATITETATVTPPGFMTDTPTFTPTPSGGTALTDNTFIEWLRSLFRQVLNR